MSKPEKEVKNKSTFETKTSGSSKSTSRVKVTKTIQKTLPNGEVVTETFTEYKEVNDEGDFAGFGTSAGDAALADARMFLHHDKNYEQDLLNKTNKNKPENKASIKARLGPEFKAESSSASSSDEEEAREEFAEDALKSHNAYRKRHGVKSLKMSKKLCSYAQEWADKLAKEDTFEHRSNNEYGENLYCSWSSNPKATITGSTPVDSWYSEVSKHTFGEEPKSMGSGHFSQVVWKSSKEFGIAKARTKSGKFIVVANYDPPGNFIGRYTENVMPPKE